MRAPDPRTRRLPAAERRTTILEAAIAVFGERGYHGASIDLIAKQAGVSKALIYEHFASKRELHASLLEDQVGELFARLAVNAQAGRTGEARLRGGVEEFLAFVEERREAFRLLFRDLADPEVAEALSRVHAQVGGLLAALMEGSGDGAAARPLGGSEEERGRALELLAVQLSGALQALANWWDAHPEVPRAELVDRAVDFAWTGLRQLRRAPA